MLALIWCACHIGKQFRVVAAVLFLSRSACDCWTWEWGLSLLPICQYSRKAGWKNLSSEYPTGKIRWWISDKVKSNILHSCLNFSCNKFFIVAAGRRPWKSCYLTYYCSLEVTSTTKLLAFVRYLWLNPVAFSFTTKAFPISLSLVPKYTTLLSFSPNRNVKFPLL